MTPSTELAPGVPEDYYRSIFDAERSHFWYRGMWAISESLLGGRMHAGGRLFDAGCGTGGFLRFLLDEGRFAGAAGADIASAAIDLARERVPEANLQVAPLHELPFEDSSFDLAVSNDVLQHVPEAHVRKSLVELRRVLASGGTLLLRTNGSRCLRRERDDWRAYDATALSRELESAGFVVKRITYANIALSLLATLRRRVPHAPSAERHGIPVQPPSRLVSMVGGAALSAERRWLGRGRTLPYGHTLFALAVRP